MSGSGLEEVWKQVNGENTVPHLMPGKAYSRAPKKYITRSFLITHCI